nr:MAG TPA: hypothetical protein [Caudoviricetes sp.]
MFLYYITFILFVNIYIEDEDSGRVWNKDFYSILKYQ